MNERIRELAEQAENYAYSSVIGGEECMEAYTKKFAELIVEECTNAIINDNRLNGVRSAANGCVRTINEHFGVDGVNE